MFTKLLGLQYKVVYKKGTENRVADALSRKSAHTSQCAALSTCCPQWLSEVVDGYSGDEETLSLLTKLSIDPAAAPDYTLK